MRQDLGNFKIGESNLHIVGLLFLPRSEEFLPVGGSFLLGSGRRHLSGEGRPRTWIKSLRRRLRPVMEGLVEVWRNF